MQKQPPQPAREKRGEYSPKFGASSKAQAVASPGHVTTARMREDSGKAENSI